MGEINSRGFSVIRNHLRGRQKLIQNNQHRITPRLLPPLGASNLAWGTGAMPYVYKPTIHSQLSALCKAVDSR